MACYNIRWKASAEKDLRSLPKTVLYSILTMVEQLSINPYPTGTKKLKGLLKSFFRVRVGDYRIIYEIDNHALVIYIIEVGHRKDIYK